MGGGGACEAGADADERVAERHLPVGDVPLPEQQHREEAEHDERIAGEQRETCAMPLGELCGAGADEHPDRGRKGCDAVRTEGDEHADQQQQQQLAAAAIADGAEIQDGCREPERAADGDEGGEHPSRVRRLSRAFGGALRQASGAPLGGLAHGRDGRTGRQPRNRGSAAGRVGPDSSCSPRRAVTATRSCAMLM